MYVCVDHICVYHHYHCRLNVGWNEIRWGRLSTACWSVSKQEDISPQALLTRTAQWPVMFSWRIPNELYSLYDIDFCLQLKCDVKRRTHAQQYSFDFCSRLLLAQNICSTRLPCSVNESETRIAKGISLLNNYDFDLSNETPGKKITNSRYIIYIIWIHKYIHICMNVSILI